MTGDLEPGQRVELSEEGRRLFPATKTGSGVVVGRARRHRGVIKVRRDGMRTADEWHQDCWRRVSRGTSTGAKP